MTELDGERKRAFHFIAILRAHVNALESSLLVGEPTPPGRQALVQTAVSLSERLAVIDTLVRQQAPAHQGER